MFAPFVSALAGEHADKTAAPAHTFAIKGGDFLLDNKPIILRSGEMHYPRTPHQYWRDRLKKAKAMGLNTVCTYVFWNIHEARKGEWNFTGDADVAAFCRMAQEEGLRVIVRPGPYVCTEWDFGGYPGWLLADRTTKVRSNDPKFLAPAREYILKVGEQLRDLQITRGGPIIMVQVENEYGSFGDNLEFKKHHETWLREAGFDVPFFTSDGSWEKQLTGGTLPDVTATINFGGNAKGNFENLEKFRPGSPRMVGEFWIGWFDAWGKKHITTSAADKGKDFAWMINNDISVNFYMFAGGTNFGFTAGANGNQTNDYTVDTTSYDYSAILDEVGNPTDKYWHFREILAKKFPAEKFPETPAPMQLQTLPEIHAWQTAPLAQLATAPVTGDAPKTMEELGESYGFILYSTEVKGPVRGMLDLGKTRDYAIISLDGKRLGALDRRLNQKALNVDIPAGKHRLEILVENLARINFGQGMIDECKGLVVTPKLAGKELRDWKMYPVSGDNRQLAKLKFSPEKTSFGVPQQTFLRATFDVADAGKDTYLDMRAWGKGVVWVNGKNLGRFWNIGPQQALYLPACWLKKGENEIVVFSLDAVEKPVTAGIAGQIWETRIDPSLLNRKPGQNLKLAAVDIVKTGKFAPGEAWQTISFDKSAKGRYLCIEAVNALDGKQFAAIAELVFVDAAGNDIPREKCGIVYADSEELAKENGSAKLVLDNQPTTWWHTQWSGKNNPGFPHQIVIDLGASREVAGFRYQPRQGEANGRIGDYRVYLREAPFAGL